MGEANDRIAVIIEDEADIRHLLQQVLEQAGFETHAAANGLEGVEQVRRYQPNVVTLDVSMPGIDGFEAAKRIRAFSDAYLVMLTARSEEIDTLMGLEAGADDYIAKPFRPRELRARIEAMLRRPRAGAGPLTQLLPVPDATVFAGGRHAEPGAVDPSDPFGMNGTVEPHVDETAESPPAEGSGTTLAAPSAIEAAAEAEGWLEHRGLRLHPEMHLVVLDTVELELTRSEFELLHLLMASSRRVRSKADLALALRSESYVTSYYVSEADKRAVEVHLANVRRKLGENALQPRWIETVRGVGYRMTAADGV